MRYWYDCEFLEDGKTIELISIGIVAEDGREYYAANSDMPLSRVKESDWLVRNVVPSLPLSSDRSLTEYVNHPQNSYPKPPFDINLDFRDVRVKPHWVIANEVRDFLLADGTPELWADYGAYDHVALCQLWGSMIALPKGIPMFTHDIQQEAARLGVTDLPEQSTGLHNALQDARHCRDRWNYLRSVIEP